MIANREALERIDAESTARAFVQHERMHGAARSLCRDLMEGRPGTARDMDEFEVSQEALIANLAHLKTEVFARSARVDPLTGLPLRYGLEQEFMRYLALAHRAKQLLVMVMIDVDHFKEINDVRGHAVGDKALRHLADLLRAEMRGGEPLFRFGGEEFLLMLHAANEEEAGRAADRLLQLVRDTPMDLAGGDALRLRISAGLAAVGTGESMAAAVQRADDAMYSAKRAGRDQWKFAPAKSECDLPSAANH